MSRSWPPMTLAVSPALLSWMQDDSVWRHQPLSWRLAQQWRAMLAGFNQRLSQAQPTSLGMSPLPDPVLIVGPWRSGTTVLHELLTAATGCPTPLTWQCMNAPAFRLTRSPPAAVAIARPMDGLSIGPLTPQEDEFALLSMGVDTAYRSFLMPHRLPELMHTLQPEYWTEDTSWLPALEQFLTGVRATARRPGLPLILKSPNHTFRLRALLRRFPNARVVWMAREPAAVLESNRKMWGAMFAQHGISDCTASDLDGFLAEALRRSAQILEEFLPSADPRRWVLCTQEELANNPRQVVLAVMNRLGLPVNLDVAELETALGSTGRGRIEHYASAPMSADLDEATGLLRAAQQRASSRLGLC